MAIVPFIVPFNRLQELLDVVDNEGGYGHRLAFDPFRKILPGIHTKVQQEAGRDGKLDAALGHSLLQANLSGGRWWWCYS